ncbi:MAG: response regulator transcription factor [Bacillus subtilis]|nr:response regulator transcription factor [Bacillus subtilis]
MVQELNPDVILMDIGMPIMDGIMASKAIKKLNSTAKIIMLTSHDNDQHVIDSFSAGASSYCMKDIEPDSLVSVIKTTYSGASWLDPRIARIVLGSCQNKNSKNKSSENVLTEREIDILQHIAKGLSNNEISETLYISLNTVKTHIKKYFS